MRVGSILEWKSALARAKKFVDDDDGYLQWLSDNPQGFVVNVYRSLNPHGYCVLRRATCWSISRYTNVAKPGAFTERQYGEVCGDSVHDLRIWLLSKGLRRLTKECSKCKPRWNVCLSG